MATPVRPLPQDTHRWIDKDGTPSKDFFNLMRTMSDAVRGITSTAITVAELPSAAENPAIRRFVSDATSTTFGSIVAGGGANIVPVYADGTGNWRIG
jgi:hypothetical protein